MTDTAFDFSVEALDSEPYIIEVSASGPLEGLDRSQVTYRVMAPVALAYPVVQTIASKFSVIAPYRGVYVIEQEVVADGQRSVRRHDVLVGPKPEETVAEAASSFNAAMHTVREVKDLVASGAVSVADAIASEEAGQERPRLLSWLYNQLEGAEE